MITIAARSTPYVIMIITGVPVAVSNLIFQPSPIIRMCGSLTLFLFQIVPGDFCTDSDHCKKEYSICDHDNNRCTGGGE